MTDETHFQALLDQNPDDHLTRLVLADWLEERGDARAAGYRALGRQQMAPNGYGGPCPCWLRSDVEREQCNRVPSDWFNLLVVRGKAGACAPLWIDYDKATRRELEDAAALAFSLLPAKRQAQLLMAPS